MRVAYVSIGNSDDKLTQEEWHRFYVAANLLLRGAADHVHGARLSEPASAWQNACWAIVPPLDYVSVEHLKMKLSELAREFRQDSIAWAEAPVTEFIPGA